MLKVGRESAAHGILNDAENDRYRLRSFGEQVRGGISCGEQQIGPASNEVGHHAWGRLRDAAGIARIKCEVAPFDPGQGGHPFAKRSKEGSIALRVSNSE